ADDEANIITVGLDHLDLRHVQHVHAAAGLGQHPRLSLGAYPRAALELLDEGRERAVPIAGTVRIVTAAHTSTRSPDARLVEDHHLHQAAAPPSGRAIPSGPSRSSGMRICATHSPSAPGPASKPARSPNCTVRRSRTLASPTPTRPPSLPGATVLRTRSVNSSPSTRASTRIVTAPSCPASPCTTAFSTSGCRIRLGTQARACASRAGTSMVSRSAKRLCCSSRYSVTNCSSSESRENSRSPAFRSRRSRSPSCTTIAWADRKSTRLNSSHRTTSYAVFCLKKKKPTLKDAGLIPAPDRALRLLVTAEP